MQTSTYIQTTHSEVSYVPKYVFVVQLHNGKHVIGHSDKPAKMIAAINSGLNPSISEGLQINRVVGVKEQNEHRTFAGTVSQFCERFGEENIIVVWLLPT